MSDSFSNDTSTSISDLKQIVAEFVAERDWRQFHSPKNLSMAMAIEVAELMEHFQWISMDESRNLSENKSKRSEIEEEVSDVLCYLLAFANEMNIDLASAMQAKMVKNRQKYPAETFKGRFGVDHVRSQSS